MTAAELVRYHQGALLHACSEMRIHSSKAELVFDGVAAGLQRNILQDLLDQPPETADELRALRIGLRDRAEAPMLAVIPHARHQFGRK